MAKSSKAPQPKEAAAPEGKGGAGGGRAAGGKGGKGGGGGVRKALTGRQKAAVFIISLGHEVASEIFKHMREDEIGAADLRDSAQRERGFRHPRPGAPGVPGADDGAGLHPVRRHRVRA